MAHLGGAACNHVGIPMSHGLAIQDVAERTGFVIIFRAVSVPGKGVQSTRLLEEGYAAKGFRIDTKSCDWGPMAGFVCVDSRLSKVGGIANKASENSHYTAEALGGKLRNDAQGGLDDDFGSWVAGAMPIVISGGRYRELAAAGLGGMTDGNEIVKGLSCDASGKVRFPWALIPASQCKVLPQYRKLVGVVPPDHYGVFVDHTAGLPFKEELHETVIAPRVLGFEPVMGLTNPGTGSDGYKACVTGDYDLFGVWPPVEKRDYFARGKGTVTNDKLRFGADPEWDVREVDRYSKLHPEDEKPHFHQHYRLGNITGRLKTVKVLLNTAIIGASGSRYKGGNIVHHSDEIGNPSPGLQKTLVESLPLIAFMPSRVLKQISWEGGFGGRTIVSETEFGDLVKACIKGEIAPVLRPEWKKYI